MRKKYNLKDVLHAPFPSNIKLNKKHYILENNKGQYNCIISMALSSISFCSPTYFYWDITVNGLLVVYANKKTIFPLSNFFMNISYIKDKHFDDSLVNITIWMVFWNIDLETVDLSLQQSICHYKINRLKLWMLCVKEIQELAVSLLLNVSAPPPLFLFSIKIRPN